jgi:5-methylcytosine-specific restriction endonuclease McrA
LRKKYKLKPIDLQYLRWKVIQKPVTATVRRAMAKLRILERDGFKCVKCGKQEMLTIHHYKYVKKYFYNDTRSYKIDSCETLCIDCHTVVNNNGGLNGQRILGGFYENRLREMLPSIQSNYKGRGTQ